MIRFSDYTGDSIAVYTDDDNQLIFIQTNQLLNYESLSVALDLDTCIKFSKELRKCIAKVKSNGK